MVRESLICPSIYIEERSGGERRDLRRGRAQLISSTESSRRRSLIKTDLHTFVLLALSLLREGVAARSHEKVMDVPRTRFFAAAAAKGNLLHQKRLIIRPPAEKGLPSFFLSFSSLLH